MPLHDNIITATGNKTNHPCNIENNQIISTYTVLGTGAFKGMQSKSMLNPQQDDSAAEPILKSGT